MLVNCRLMDSLSRRIFQTGCGIMGRIILFVSPILELLMMCALAKVLDWEQSFPWLPTWTDVHLLTEDCWGHNLDIQNCDETFYWTTLALGRTSILGRLHLPCWESYSWYCLIFTLHKATGSALSWSSILICHVLYAFLLALTGLKSYFQLFHYGSGCWLHSRKLFVLLNLLSWWRHCWKIICCLRDSVRL